MSLSWRIWPSLCTTNMDTSLGKFVGTFFFRGWWGGGGVGKGEKALLPYATSESSFHTTISETYLSICLCKINQYFVYSVKPIFHWKLGLRWVPNANEINTKNMKCTWPTQEICIWYRLNLYSTDSRWGFALGDAKNLRYLTQKIPTCWYFCVR